MTQTGRARFEGDRSAGPLVSAVGVDRLGFQLDMAALVYCDNRIDAGSYLWAHGRRTAGTSDAGLFTQYGLQPIEGDEAPFGEVVNLSAELTEQK
ncbi:hypothetical protein [Mycobacterium sp.]|uniref:hypothetical protein n=1 Tax=Mycobacterium sp. TaxID=1785 RepID=UPI003C726149